MQKLSWQWIMVFLIGVFVSGATFESSALAQNNNYQQAPNYNNQNQNYNNQNYNRDSRVQKFRNTVDKTQQRRTRYDNTEDVSTLNNELVKVGNKNDYSYNFPRFNISSNPFGWFYGSYGLSFGFAFHQNFAVRLDADYLNGDYLGLINREGFEINLAVPIYFSKVYNGFFLEPGISFNSLDIGTTNVQLFGPGIKIGYHWFWDIGLNVALAAGINKNISSDETFEFFNNVIPAAYLRFGYAFDVR